MAHVNGVPTIEFRHPVRRLVLMETDDAPQQPMVPW
jgi:hypothetical protein